MFDGETARHVFIHSSEDTYQMFAGIAIKNTTVDHSAIFLFEGIFNGASSSLSVSGSSVLSGDAGSLDMNGLTLTTSTS